MHLNLLLLNETEKKFLNSFIVLKYIVYNVIHKSIMLYFRKMNIPSGIYSDEMHDQTNIRVEKKIAFF